MRPSRRLVKKKVPKVPKVVKKPSKDEVLKNGNGLNYKKGVSIDITAVNNGYIVIVGRNSYVFSNSEELMDFIKGEIPMKGTESNFIDSLDDEDEDEDGDGSVGSLNDCLEQIYGDLENDEDDGWL